MTDDESAVSSDSAPVDPATVDLRNARAMVRETTPLVNALTNEVTVNDVANVTLHWGDCR
nr:hydroxyethylthiazole kinase [Halorubrum halophilum]